MNVPAWPMPIHQTKLTIANPHATGMLMPQMPTPLTSSQVDRDQEQHHDQRSAIASPAASHAGGRPGEHDRADLVGDRAVGVPGASTGTPVSKSPSPRVPSATRSSIAVIRRARLRCRPGPSGTRARSDLTARGRARSPGHVVAARPCPAALQPRPAPDSGSRSSPGRSSAAGSSAPSSRP